MSHVQDNFQRCPCRIFWRRNVTEPIDLSQMPDILLRDKLWGPLSWGNLSSFFFSVVSALMCFDPWVWELPSLTLLRYMALTSHTLPYLIIPTHSYRILSLTLFHPKDFFPCPRLPNITYPALLYPRATEILKSKSVRSTDDVIGTCQIVTKTNDSSFSYKSVSEIDYLSNTL